MPVCEVAVLNLQSHLNPLRRTKSARRGVFAFQPGN
jgi:hypothetical protein